MMPKYPPPRWTLSGLFVAFPTASVWAEDGGPVVDLWAKGIEVVGYLFVFVVLAALLVHLSKRYQPYWGASGPIHIVDSRSLGPNVGVRLVRVGTRAWLLGITRENISLLAEVNTGELPPEKSTANPATTPGWRFGP